MSAEEYTRMFNLVSTRSVGSLDDISYDGFNLSLAAINNGNCVNLYNYIREFSYLYQSFKEDYKKLSEIELLDKYRLSSYHETIPNKVPCCGKCVDAHYKSLRYVSDDSILNFMCLNGNYKLVNTNPSNLEDKTRLICDTPVIREYLDFGKKYCELINRYNVIVNSLRKIKVNGDILLSLKFDIDDLSKLGSITYSFGMYKINFILTYSLTDCFRRVLSVQEVGYDFSDEQVDKIAQSINVDKSFVYGLEAFDGNSRKLVNKNTI